MLQFAVQLYHLHLVLVHLIADVLHYGRLGAQLAPNVLAFVLDRRCHANDLVKLLLLSVKKRGLLGL